MIAIIDYGAGNLQSVKKALDYLGCKNEITKNRQAILQSDGVILPGVGSFGDAAANLEKSGMKDAAIDYIHQNKPFLGICLGLQLLFGSSEESPGAAGLGRIAGKISRFPDAGLKVPHIGWNSVEVNPGSRLFKGIEDGTYFYFVHSYCLHAANSENVAARANYGVDFDAAVEKGNLFATQFHPEKSGEAGLSLLKNFIDIVKDESC